MAEFMKMLSRRLAAGSCLACLLGLAAQAATPENLPDPTRPPAALGEAGATAVASGPVLQSVLISPGRRVAVISGQTVQVGDKVGDARVARITEGEAVLVRDGKSQTLKLFPGLEKRRSGKAHSAPVQVRPQ